MNKICKDCNLLLPISNFRAIYTKNKVKFKGRRGICIKCEKLKDNRLKIEAVNFMGNCCFHCKLNSPNTEIYDFHHIDPNKKEFAISSLRNRVSLEDIKEELNKCVMLCANCHRQVHSGNIILNIC